VDANAQFWSLAEPGADSGTSTGGLMLAVLGGLADVERDLIRRTPPKAGTAPRPEESTWADTYRGATKRGHQTARGGCYVAGIGKQLRPQHFHHAPRYKGRMSSAN
jgi:hypothetical protein